MKSIYVSLMSYVADNRQCLPPFAFSDYTGNLPLSGHYGGASREGAPDESNRQGVRCVNLQTLVMEKLILPDQLICPGAAGELRTSETSCFPYTLQFSTYCLRFPYSEDLFATAPNLRYFLKGGLLSVYIIAAGGQPVRVGAYRQRVPQVHLGRRYRIMEPVACGDGNYDAFADAMLSDSFWYQDTDQAPPPSIGGIETYRVRFSWCHGGKFNVLYGQGAVVTVSDTGAVAENTVPVGGLLEDDGRQYATYAERVWQFFDSNRE